MWECSTWQFFGHFYCTIDSLTLVKSPQPHASLAGVICLYIGFLLISSGHPNLTGAGFLVKVVDTPARVNWHEMFVYGDICPTQWTPQPNWHDMYAHGTFGPKQWTPQPNWHEVFAHGDYCPSSGHPNLTGVMCLCTGISVQSCGHLSLTGTMCYIGIGPKLWTNCNFKHEMCVYTGEYGPKVSLRYVHPHSTCICNMIVTFDSYCIHIYVEDDFFQESTRTAQKWSTNSN